MEKAVQRSLCFDERLYFLVETGTKTGTKGCDFCKSDRIIIHLDIKICRISYVFIQNPAYLVRSTGIEPAWSYPQDP